MFNPTTNVGNYDVLSTRHSVQSSAKPPKVVHNQQNTQASCAAYQNQQQVGSTVPNQVGRNQNQAAGYHNQQQPQFTGQAHCNAVFQQGQQTHQQQRSYKPHLG